MRNQDDDNDKDTEGLPYEVGYGRTPEGSRYRKGQSGNPSGRPKGAKSFDEFISDKLDSKVDALHNGRRKRVQLREMMAAEVVKAAAKGDRHARKVMLEADARAQARRTAAAQSTARDLENDRLVFETIMARLTDAPGEEDEG